MRDYFPSIKSTGPVKIVDFAPSRFLSPFIKRLMASAPQKFSYRTADLFMRGVDDKVDITNMTSYQDNQFDFFLSSHILEHVIDDKKAMRELYRILKPGGRGILMVPIILTFDGIDEDPTITDIAERWRRFGQHDHLRLYGKKAYIERVKEAGFLIHQLGSDFFGAEAFTRHGITSQSVLYIVEKPNP
jgi:SAM-dependent methyltransferase